MLAIFREQSAIWAPLLAADHEGWRDAVHTLKGASRGIGAFAVGEACARCEIGGPAGLGAVRDALDDALHDIAAYQHERALKSLKSPGRAGDAGPPDQDFFTRRRDPLPARRLRPGLPGPGARARLAGGGGTGRDSAPARRPRRGDRHPHAPLAPRPFAAATRREKAELRRSLRSAGYDRVIDAQGLIRSAWLGRLAGAPLCGYDIRSIREPLASLWYDRRFPVSVTAHAAERMRRLAAQAMGYAPPPEADYGLTAEAIRPAWLPDGRYFVALHATARPDKAWDEGRWIALARRAAEAGLTVVAPWGSPAERERSERIAAAAPGAIAPPRLSYTELAGVLAGAAAVVGVDTGLTHLASAVGAPVVALYLASWAEFNGVIGPGFIANLGGPGETPGGRGRVGADPEGAGARPARRTLAAAGRGAVAGSGGTPALPPAQRPHRAPASLEGGRGQIQRRVVLR